MSAMRIAKRDALVAMKRRYPALPLTPLRMSDALLTTAPPRHKRNLWDRKLTDEQVLDIRRRYSDGISTVPEMSAEYDIGTRTIYRVLSGETYKEVG